jgi:hypothetical protein
MSWYSAGHVELAKYRKDQDLSGWNRADQGLWDWQGGLVEEHTPVSFFDDIEAFDFKIEKCHSIPQIQKHLEGNNELGKRNMKWIRLSDFVNSGQDALSTRLPGLGILTGRTTPGSQDGN